jgi:hypothetical protein
VKIELLYFRDCHVYKTALENIQEVIKEKELDTEVDLREIKNDKQALRDKFLGSPTVRINGIDIDPSAQKINKYSMTCRLYLENSVVNELPSKRMIRQAIDKSLIKESMKIKKSKQNE